LISILKYSYLNIPRQKYNTNRTPVYIDKLSFSSSFYAFKKNLNAKRREVLVNQDECGEGVINKWREDNIR